MNMKMTWYSTVASSDKLSEFRHETHTLSTGNDKTRQAMHAVSTVGVSLQTNFDHKNAWFEKKKVRVEREK